MTERRREEPAGEPAAPAAPPAPETGYTQEEEEEVRKRLEDLGYVE